MVVLLFPYCLCVDTCLLDDITKYFCGGSFSEKLLRVFQLETWRFLFFILFYARIVDACMLLHGLHTHISSLFNDSLFFLPCYF